MSHHAWEARTIPSVAYTDPEVAWMGLTETEAKAKGVEYDKAVFNWGASGRALGMGREEGLTKILFAKETQEGPGRRHRRHQRRRADRGDRAGAGDGRRRRGPQPHDPRPPDPVRDDLLRGRDRRRHDHRSAAGQAVGRGVPHLAPRRRGEVVGRRPAGEGAADAVAPLLVPRPALAGRGQTAAELRTPRPGPTSVLKAFISARKGAAIKCRRAAQSTKSVPRNLSSV